MTLGASAVQTWVSDRRRCVCVAIFVMVVWQATLVAGYLAELPGRAINYIRFRKPTQAVLRHFGMF
jgi:hypothetical protein